MVKKEWKRLLSNPILIVVLFAIILIPSIYAGFFLASMWDPYGELDKLPVAVVNLDKPIEFNGSTLSVGDDLVENLKEDMSLDFCFVDKDEAESGLRDGKYYMVVTIPEDFSANASTVMDAEPQKMVLDYETNPATNYVAMKLSESAMVKLQLSLQEKVTETYTKSVFDKLNEIGDGFTEAASGASQILDGEAELSDGIGQLSDGAQRLSDGSFDLSRGINAYLDGANAVNNGAASLNSGIGELNSGASSLATGASSLSSGINNLAGQLPALASGISSVADGSKSLETGITTYTSGVSQSLSGATTISTNMAALSQGASTLSSSSAGIKNNIDSLSALANNIAAGSSDPYVLQLAGGLSALSEGYAGFDSGLSGLSSSASALSAGAAQLEQGLTALDSNSASLVSGASALAAGASQLNAAVPALSEGVGQLSNGASTLASGASTLASGADRLSSGSSELLSGTQALTANNSSLREGASSLASGASDLASGTQQLADAEPELADGIGELRDALDEGATSINDTNKTDVNAQMFANPLTVNETKITEVDDNGHAMAAYMMSVGLWVASLAFCLMYPLTKHEGVTSGFKWWLSKASVLYPMAILQAVILVAVLHFTLGFEPARIGQTIFVACLTSVAFMSIMYFFNVLLGKVGSFLMLIFMVLQLAGSAGTYPIEVSGSLAQALNRYMPFTYTVQAFRSAIGGGEPFPVCVRVLLGIFLISSVLTVILFLVRGKKEMAGKRNLYDVMEEKGFT